MTVEQEGGLLLRTLRKWADEDFVKFLEGGHGRRRRRNRRDRSDGFVADLHCSSCILVEKQSFFWWEPVENEINFVCFHSCLIWLDFIFLFYCSAKPDVMDVVRSVAQWRLEQVTGRRSQARMEAAQQKKNRNIIFASNMA
jgi:hypothetical protein